VTFLDAVKTRKQNRRSRTGLNRNRAGAKPQVSRCFAWFLQGFKSTFAHQEQFDELWARQPCIVRQHRIRCSGTKPTIRGDYQCIPMRESFEAIDIREVN
jgi:hypothetical protein